MTGRDWVLADAFDRAAPTYDAMVALSPGYHDQLRTAADTLVEQLPRQDGRTAVLLDLGCGSGASTRAVLDAWAAAGKPSAGLAVTGVDASAGMVAQARSKSWPDGVDLVVSDAASYLRGLADASVDGVLGAYLLRNVPDRQALVDEVARVLRPGAAFVLHDYSVAGSLRARVIWAAVCHGVIIPLAWVKRSDVPLHRYLYTSVRDFDSVEQVCGRMQTAGLGDVRHRSYSGWQADVVHTVVGRRAA